MCVVRRCLFSFGVRCLMMAVCCLPFSLHADLCMVVRCSLLFVGVREVCSLLFVVCCVVLFAACFVLLIL